MVFKYCGSTQSLPVCLLKLNLTIKTFKTEDKK